MDELRKIRKKQEQCNHESFVCTFCRLYKDNINSEQAKIINEQEAYIFSLEAKLALYE